MTARRLVCVTAAVAVLATVTAIVLFWQWLLMMLLSLTVGRHVYRRAFPAPARRARPKSSWARNLQAGSVAFAALQTRHLRPAKTREPAPGLLPPGTLRRTAKPGTRRAAS